MWQKLNSSRNGQSIVETALVLPIVILIFTGIIDFGILFGNYMLITSASREAARTAAIGLTDAEVITAAENMAEILDRSKMTVNIYPVEGMRQKGEEVSVTIIYDNDLLTPVVSSIIPNPLKLTAKTTMRVE